MIRNLILLFAAVISLASCVDLKEVKCTGINGFKVNKVNTGGIDAQLSLRVNNPNTFGFKLLPSEFSVAYGGIKLGKAKLVKKVKIRASSEADYTFSLNGDFKNLALADVLKLLESFSKKSVLEVNGELRVGKLFTKKSFPVNIREKISADN